jgi:hypothetical protein
MEQKVFISYSDFDRDKVKLLINELKTNPMFSAIVIANNREALEPLAKKVADGIIRSDIFIPILTRNSIMTQWINQEIGFATALNKKVLPIVENDQISNLKGFIHKQIDLPYNFPSNSKKATENKNFIKQVRLLISDIENMGEKLAAKETPVEKTDHEKNLEKIDKLNEEIGFMQKRKAFLNSIEGANSAKKEVFKMFADIDEKILKLAERNFFIVKEKGQSRPYLILKCDGYCVTFDWQQRASSSIEDALLLVKNWKGIVTEDRTVYIDPKIRADVLSESKYTFERNRQNEFYWESQSNYKKYTSTQIVDTSIEWLVEQSSKKRIAEF